MIPAHLFKLKDKRQLDQHHCKQRERGSASPLAQTARRKMVSDHRHRVSSTRYPELRTPRSLRTPPQPRTLPASRDFMPRPSSFHDRLVKVAPTPAINRESETTPLVLLNLGPFPHGQVSIPRIETIHVSSPQQAHRGREKHDCTLGRAWTDPLLPCI